MQQQQQPFNYHPQQQQQQQQQYPINNNQPSPSFPQNYPQQQPLQPQWQQQPGAHGNAGGQGLQGGPNLWQGAATQLMMDPNTLQTLGTHAFESGQQYLDKNMNRWVNWTHWKYYWNVTNSFVVKKVALILFPFRHSSWSRQSLRSEMNGHMEGYRPPRHDVNAPDLYIPAMAFLTYILLVGFIMGTEDKFTPEVLTLAASSALFFNFIQVLFLRLGFYLLSINMQELCISLGDLIAYSSYQNVDIILIQLSRLAFRDTWIPLCVVIYASISLGWFTLRSLRYLVFPAAETTPSMANPKSVPMRKTRVYFLFTFVVIQIFSTWFLSRG